MDSVGRWPSGDSARNSNIDDPDPYELLDSPPHRAFVDARPFGQVSLRSPGQTVPLRVPPQEHPHGDVGSTKVS
jgi:hypothetical protein